MKKYISWYLVVPLCVFWLLTACEQSKETKTSEQIVEQQQVTEIRTAEAKIGRMVSAIAVTGAVFALREARILPKVSGRVERIMVVEGEQAEKGQVLVQLEQQDFLLAKHRAEAALGTANAAFQQLLAGARSEDIQQAQAALSQARASLEEAKGDYERIKRLHDENVASQQMHDAAKARYTIARQSVNIAFQSLKKAKTGPTEEDIQVAKARVREAEVGLEIAEQQLQDSTVQSPFPGIIAEKFVNEGEIVSSISPSPLFWLVEMRTVKIECAIPESELSRVEPGSEATIEVDAYPEDQFVGDITRISPVVDPASLTFKVTIEIPNSDYRLKPGMFARVNIVAEVHENTVIVPRSAVTRTNGKEVVFVIEGDTAVLREVIVGLQDEEFVEIIQGIQAGERVIIEGNYGLENGTRVQEK
jgi:multidrug resistance efflux pump